MRALNGETPSAWSDPGSGDTTQNAATGAPTITGVAQVGETLTAGTSGIMDADGLTGVSYSFQWVGEDADGSNSGDISGATAGTYTLAAADEGRRVRVRVSFTDDGGNDEALMSDAYPSGTVAPAAQLCSDRTHSEWCTEMTVGVEGSRYGFNSGTYGTLVDSTIEYGDSVVYAMSQLSMVSTPPSVEFRTVFDANVPSGTVFNFAGSELIVDEDALDAMTAGNYEWNLASFSGRTWTEEGRKVTVSANLPPLLLAATVNGDQLVLTWHEDLDGTSVPAAGAFTVTVAGSTRSLAADDPVVISGTTVTLTLSSAARAWQTVTVSYAVPASNPIQDAAGIDAPAVTTNVTDEDGNLVLVSNTGETLQGGSSTHFLASSFTTGDHSAGYTLDRVH